MEEINKAVEIMKAAMEREQMMSEKSKESMEEQIDEEAQKMTQEQGKENKDNHVENDFEKVSKADLGTEIPENISLEETETSPEEETFAGQPEEELSEDKKEKAVKSLFKNKKELAAKDQKIEELTDRLMRNMAEFDNFRKRSEKEKAQMYDIGVKSIVEKLLPIVDNFERGLGAISDKEKEGAFAQGIELIHKQLMTALDEIGVKPIDAVGKEFDPNLHNAVMHGEDESMGTNIVSDEFQKGYMYRDYVVRHSMVKVVN